MKISVIIPAHNEEKFLPDGLAAVAEATRICPCEVETVVVLNRCTDRTEEIAREAGAIIAREEAKNLSLIRNAGVAASTGDIIVTVDADSQLHPQFLRIIVEKMKKNIVGGGVFVLPERWSLGIICSAMMLLPYVAKYKVSVAAFWTSRKYFDAIGGFNPEFVTIEDIDFGVRLRKYGKSIDKKWGTVWTAPLITSCRKFDQFGDWHVFKDKDFIKRAFEGNDREIADLYWYNQRD